MSTAGKQRSRDHPYTRDFYTSYEHQSRDSARVIAGLVAPLVQPKSVLDVGCGMGLWLTAFQERGAIDILGIDGAYVTRNGALWVALSRCRHKARSATLTN